MNKIQLHGLILNFIIYVIITLPLIILTCKKSIFKNKKIFTLYFTFSVLIETVLSIILYIFSENIFSLFTNIPGVINYCVYSSKILFICASLYPALFLIPFYIVKNTNSNKKTTILVLSKIVVHIIFIFIGYILFSNKGILFSFPLCDFIYFIIYIISFLKILS